MAEFYRFRSVDVLLGEEYSELDRQTIFFADPADLNDPMEGFRDIVWTGDRIVWTNLFKDYVNCLHWNFHHMLVLGESVRFEPRDIRNVPSWKEAPTHAAAKLSEAIWARVQETDHVNQLANKIANSNRKARKSELIGYVISIHLYALEAVRESYIEKGWISDENWPRIHLTREIPTLMMKAIDLGDQIEDKRFLDIALSLFDHYMAQNALIYKYNHKDESASTVFENKMYLIHYFPSLYVEQLSRLLWPDWYAACFAKSPHNSSMWGHYGKNHKGACLIFSANNADDTATIDLKQVTGSGEHHDSSMSHVRNLRAMPFYEIHYGEKPSEVDFFKSIGKLPSQSLLDLWYTDEDGNVSDCADHLAPYGEQHAWRKRHWENFYRDITFKTKDWEYEQEYRLVVNGLISESLDDTDRTLTYDFSSLKGIIFGMRTSDEDKQRVIEIVDRKCRDHHRTDFEFYQSYYDPVSGEMRSRPLDIRFVGIG